MINQGLKIGWDYEVLAITKTHALVYLSEDFKQEWVSYQHDNKGNCYSGLYTRDKQTAVEDYIKRSKVYL